MNLISDTAFRIFLTVLIGVLAGGWVIHDAVLLARLRGAKRDALVGDKRFGYVMGIAIGTIGVYGTLRFNGVL